MLVTVTGATGLIGTRLVAALRARGDDVTILSRDPSRGRDRLDAITRAQIETGHRPGGLQAIRWDPASEPAPAAALAGRDAVVHLAGENIAQRWTDDAKRAIRESRVTGTRHLVDGLAACATEERPRVLVSASAIGFYGPHGPEPIDEEAPGGNDFLARLCAEWEARAQTAERDGVRVVLIRNGVVLACPRKGDPDGGALAKMLTPFRLGVGGPVAGGRQYMSWVHVEDIVGIVLAAIDGEGWRGPVNATAPEPVSNREFSRALGQVLKRPSLAPVPAFALRLLYGEMAQIVTTGARVLPSKALMLGYRFKHPELVEALRSAVG